MYTPEDRERLRSELVAEARADHRITGGALTGSAAAGAEDEWSDVDLAFGVGEAAVVGHVLADWTARMYERRGALHHMDVVVGSTVYRVFLLPSTLQVDLAFGPASEFGARAPTFRLLFGKASEMPRAAPPAAEQLAGMAWLYALHARSCIARGRAWQAEYMISGVRDQTLALACLRHGLPTAQGRGVDRLPAPLLSAFEGALVRGLDGAELARAFGVAVELLLDEIGCVDGGLRVRLEGVLRELAGR